MPHRLAEIGARAGLGQFEPAQQPRSWPWRVDGRM